MVGTLTIKIAFRRTSVYAKRDHPPDFQWRYCFHCWTPILHVCEYFSACEHRFYDNDVDEGPATRARARVARTREDDA